MCFMFYQIQLEQMLVISQFGKLEGGRGLFLETSMFGTLKHVQLPCRFNGYLHKVIFYFLSWTITIRSRKTYEANNLYVT